MAQTKIQYTLNESDPVRLFQYIFSYENKGDFALFNFHNQHDDILESMSFIVKQYDKDENLLVKNKMSYDDLCVKSNSFFVPKLKLVIDSLCDHIEVEVVEAIFEFSKYFEGEIISTIEEVVEEEKFDPSTLHYFHNNKILMFQKPILAFLVTLIFILIAFLILYLAIGV